MATNTTNILNKKKRENRIELNTCLVFLHSLDVRLR